MTEIVGEPFSATARSRRHISAARRCPSQQRGLADLCLGQLCTHSSERTVAIVTRESLGEGTTLYAHVDHLGSVDVLTDDGGKLVERRSYDTFGARRNPLWGKPPPASFSSLTTTKGFTWHESEDELGLINMKGRMYDPKVGRFLTTDPVVSDPFSGQGWNPYSYVFNNPLTFVDPSGFSAVPVEASSPPPDCTDQGRLCGSSGRAIRPIEVTIRAPRSAQGPREEATKYGAATTPTDVGTAGTAVGFAPTPDPTAASSLAGHVGRFSWGLGKAYAYQVLDIGKSLYLNILTFGGYSIHKYLWHIAESVLRGIEESRELGEHGGDVALSVGASVVNAANPLYQIGVGAANIKSAIDQGNDEALGEAVEPVVVAIVTAVAIGKVGGAEAAVAEEGGGLADLAKFRGELGLPAGEGTLARLDAGGKSFYGINAHGQPVSLRVNAITRTHAEADAFQQAANDGVAGGRATLYVDRALCSACGSNGGVLGLARQLGLTEVKVITPQGTQFMQP